MTAPDKIWIDPNDNIDASMEWRGAEYMDWSEEYTRSDLTHAMLAEARAEGRAEGLREALDNRPTTYAIYGADRTDRYAKGYCGGVEGYHKTILALIDAPAPAHDYTLSETLGKTVTASATQPRWDLYNDRMITSPAQPSVQEAALVLAGAMERREWSYYPIEMPVSSDGNGPATVGVDATSITYEVWESATLKTISSHENLPDAIAAALRAIAEETDQ